MAEQESKQKRYVSPLQYLALFLFVMGYLYSCFDNLLPFYYKESKTKNTQSVTNKAQKEAIKPSPSPEPSPKTTKMLQTEKLFKALNKKNFTLVKKMIKENPHLLEAKDKNGNTPLLRAVYLSDKELLKHLLSLGANPNIQDKFGKTPLHYTLDEEDLEIVKMLLDNKASLNIRDEDGYSPLHRAINCWWANKTAKFYILNGADLNIKDKRLMTPIFYSISQNNYHLSKLMIEKGAKLNIKSEWGTTPLHYVKEKNLAELLLEKGSDVKAMDNRGNTPLHYISSYYGYGYTNEEYNQKVTIAKLYLSKGADINAKNSKGMTPLHLAGVCGYSHLARFFIDNGADVTIRDINNKTPLDLALKEKHHKTAAILLTGYFFKYPFLRYLVLLLIIISIYIVFRKFLRKPGKAVIICLVVFIIINISNNPVFAQALNSKENLPEAKTPAKIQKEQLFKAFESFDYQRVKKLVEANPFLAIAKDKRDEPAIFYAVGSGRKELVELVGLFLSKGADPNSKDFSGNTPLFIAIYKEDLETARLLLDWGADINLSDRRKITVLHKAVLYNCNINTINFLLENGADINRRDGVGLPPIYYSASEDDPELFYYLVKKGAKIDFKSSYGSTLLHTVRNIKLAEYLINRGLDVNAATEDGYTPLHCLPHGLIDGFYDKKESRNIEMAKLFLSNGANINAINEEGETPLHIAIYNGHIMTANFLINRGADVSIKDKRGMTPFKYAVQGGRVSTAFLILTSYLINNPITRFLSFVLLLWASYITIKKILKGKSPP